MIELGWMDLAWKVLITLVNAAGWIWMYLTNRDKVTNSRITKLEADIDQKMDDHSERLARMEERAENAPNHDHLARLHARIDEVAGALKRIEGESSSQTRILNLVYESLIKGPK